MSIALIGRLRKSLSSLMGELALPVQIINAFQGHRLIGTCRQWLQSLYYSYPLAPGHLNINHWSNGNSKWSQGPPAVNAVLTVKYVKAYFNTSDAEKIQQFEEGCNQKEAPAACVIPDDAGSRGSGKS